MLKHKLAWVLLCLQWLVGDLASAEEMLTLRGRQVEMVWAPAGGALVRLRFLDDETNRGRWSNEPAPATDINSPAANPDGPIE